MSFFDFFIFFFRFLFFVLPLLLAVAFLTLAERKILASMQRRVGPNSVGFIGLFQPLADGVKLLVKETIFPSFSSKFLFLLAPLGTFSLALSSWSILPISPGLVFSDINAGILFLFAISSLNVYSIVISGWSSNSRYAFLGGLRSSAQMISYEVSLGLILLSIISTVGSLNLSNVVLFQRHVWFIFPFFPLFILFFVSVLAETNRPPFDLPEAEAELVSGYNVEYSAVGFVLFFIGEYANVILMSVLTSVLFFGGWLSPIFELDFPFFWISFKSVVLLFFFIWIRAAFPRYRYDQLMRLGWKVFLPLSLGWLFGLNCLLFAFDFLPNQFS